ncbi:MAG: hypothetical protein AAFU85_02090 [Planctomycetota bacterium]
MRKDVNRALVVWPLTASALACLVVILSFSNDRLSRTVVDRSADAWVAAGGPAFWQNQNVTGALAQADGTDSGPRSAIERSASEKPFAAIEAWNDVPLSEPKSPRPATKAVPTAPLDSSTDLFEFPLVSSEANSTASAERTQNGALAMPRPERIVAADETRNEDALELNLNVAAPYAQPEEHAVVLPMESIAAVKPGARTNNEIGTGLESSTNAILEYEAPAPFVADLAPRPDLDEPESESLPNLTKPGLDATELQRPSLPPANQLTDAIDAKPAEMKPLTPDVESINRHRADDREQPQGIADSTRDRSTPALATWPVPRQLLDQLDALESRIGSVNHEDQRRFAVLAWTRRVKELLVELPKSPRLGDTNVGSLLDELASLRGIAAKNASLDIPTDQRVAWLQAAYAVERRLAVWQPVFAINSGDEPASQRVTDDTLSAAASLDAVEAEFEATGDAEGWYRFLAINQLRHAFTSGDDAAKSEAAQLFLTRLKWPNLTQEHQDWLRTEPFQRLADVARPWASRAIDYASLLHQIERAESNAIDLVTTEIAESMRALSFASHPRAKQLATNLEMHYRNANLRLAISDRLINHLLPEIPSRRVPVRTNLLGSRVTGVSEVSSDLSVALIPSNNEWRLSLHTDGNVLTRSVGRRGPAAVSTASRNQYGASTPISIKPTDVTLGRSVVDVTGGSRLRGIDTDFDGWPLIGSLVRGIAESEYWQKASLSDRIAGNRMRSEIGVQIDKDVQTRLDEASEKFSRSILGPLVSLRLEPKVVDMQTTQNRLVARYRMAGDWQLAAMTPRPRAPSDSLFSIQVHQSAMNNTLEQLFVQSTPEPIEDLMTQCFDLIGVKQGLPEDLPQGVRIQFAKHRPITIEIEDNRVWMTLRVIRLEKENGITLRNFIVRASYKPDYDGLHAFLVRDGHLSISGPRMSMRQRLPVRAIFNKVLSPTQRVSLTNPDMLVERLPSETLISQVELRDGWVGLAFSIADSPQAAVARRPIGLK